MTTATVIRGIIKKKLPDKEGKTKAGKSWVKKTFILTPEDGSKDLFVSTFGKFDNTLIGKIVEVEAEQFNDTSYNAKGDPVAVEGNEAVTAPVTETVAVVAEKATVTTSTPVASKSYSSDGVDWAAKDRAQAIGGLMHDAAALVAPTVTKTSKVEDVIARVEETILALIELKLRAEATLKGKQ